MKERTLKILQLRLKDVNIMIKAYNGTLTGQYSLMHDKDSKEKLTDYQQQAKEIEQCINWVKTL